MMRCLVFGVMVTLCLGFVCCTKTGPSQKNSTLDLYDAIPRVVVTTPAASTNRENALNQFFPFLTTAWAHEADFHLKRFDLQLMDIIEERLARKEVTSCLSAVNESFEEIDPDPHCANPDGRIKSPVAGDNGEACATAKMKEITLKGGVFINGSLNLLSAVVCAAKVKGMKMPEMGETLDFMSVVNNQISGLTFKVAALEHLKDTGEGASLFKFNVEVGFAGNRVMANLVHTLGADKVSSGRLNGYTDLSQGGAGFKRLGYSFTFDRKKDDYAFVVKSGTSVPFLAEAPSVFDSVGNYDFRQKGFQNNGYYLRAQIFPTSGLGTMYTAWQPSRDDKKSRVFQISTSASAKNSQEVGVAYFGFGPDITDGKVGILTGLPVATKTQSQSLSRDVAKGIFVPVASHLTDMVAYGSEGTIPSISEPTF